MKLVNVLASHGVVGSGDTIPPRQVLINQWSGYDSDNQHVWLGWAEPIDSEYKGVRIVRSTSNIPSSLTDGTLIYNGLGYESTVESDAGEGYKTTLNGFDDDDIEYSTTYYYRLFPYDKNGNFNTVLDEQTCTTTTGSAS